MVNATTTRTCGQCQHHETALTILSEGGSDFPGLEFWCRQGESRHFNQVVTGVEADGCRLYVRTEGGSDTPL